jgi:hypothetical protein
LKATPVPSAPRAATARRLDHANVECSAPTAAAGSSAAAATSRARHVTGREPCLRWSGATMLNANA